MTKYCNNSIFQILIFAFLALQIVSVPWIITRYDLLKKTLSKGKGWL